jgi:hypothetical protein
MKPFRLHDSYRDSPDYHDFTEENYLFYTGQPFLEGESAYAFSRRF